MFSTNNPAQWGSDGGKVAVSDSVVVTGSPRALFPSPVAAMIAAAAEKDASGPPVRVRVVEPYRVSFQGKHFVGGQTLSVPPARVEAWIKSGWVTPVSTKGKK